MYMLFVRYGAGNQRAVWACISMKAARQKIAELNGHMIKPQWRLMDRTGNYQLSSDESAGVDLSHGGAVWEGIVYEHE